MAEASDGVDAVARAAHLHPDLVLLDIRMPNLDGIKAAAQIRTISPQAKILFLSTFTDPDIVQSALGDGAAGYICKSEMNRELLPAIEAALEPGGAPGGTIATSNSKVIPLACEG